MKYAIHIYEFQNVPCKDVSIFCPEVKWQIS